MKPFTVRIRRFNPDTDEESHIETYTVNVNDGARVLHVLHAIHDELDPTLSFRYSCASGQCGSCAVRVNGEPVLACTEEAQDGITIEPLNLPVKKDLVVDLLPGLAAITPLKPVERPVRVTKAAIDAIKPLKDCIECLACVSVCPAMDVAAFLGPTAMRQEMRLALDPRNIDDRISAAVHEGLFTCTHLPGMLEGLPEGDRDPGESDREAKGICQQKRADAPSTPGSRSPDQGDRAFGDADRTNLHGNYKHRSHRTNCPGEGNNRIFCRLHV